MTARFAPASPPFAPGIQAWLDRTMPPGVPPLTLFTTLARDERLFSRFFAGGLLDKGHLTLRQREIVICRTTALSGCEYEWGVHMAFFAERVGFDEACREALVHANAEATCWHEPEPILITACDELHRGCTLSDSTWLELRASFSEEAVLEVVMLASFYRGVACLANSIGLSPEPFAARFPAASG